MSFLDDLRARVRELGRDVVDSVAGNVADSTHSAVYLRQLFRGNRAPHAQRAESGAKAGTNAGQPPVLLIHGYLATRGSLHLFEQHLADRGHIVISYPLGFPVNMRDIRDSAGLIARKVESIVGQTGVTRLDVVGHSMGGLVGLYYLKRLGGRHRVRRLVMMGTPTQGTWSALLGLVTAPFGRASLQLLPGSPFLRELEEIPLPEGAEVISIGAIRDWLAPLSTTVLDGVRHIAVATGHSGLLVDAEVARVVADLLDAPAPDRTPGVDETRGAQ
ncbi:MAG TPA: alpha/beta fold hydrolase [Polyangia bacterium]|nr:alpha/beta fold hydrolase [Polyangia bacterium]